MRRVRFSGMLIWLTVLWVALWGDPSVANVLSGLLVSALVLSVARQPSVRRSGRTDVPRIRPLAMIWFVLYVIYKLVEANLVIAWEIVTPRNRINTGVVAVPLRTEFEFAQMVVANVITLTPGTVTLEVGDEPAMLYVNVLHLHDLDRVRHDLLRIEELAVRAFGSERARRQFAEAVS